MITPRQMLCPESKKSIKFPHSMNPTRIVVHNTANDASANNEIAYMNSNNNQVSFHFAVDGNEVVQGLPLDVNGWHSGDGAHGVGNREGIAIEMCYTKRGGDRFDKAEELAAEFIAQLLKERGWDLDRVTKHQDYSGKYCPHRTLDYGWDRFLDKIRHYMETDVAEDVPNQKSVHEIANEVIRGDWGNGQERKDRLTASGYSYEEVQKEVNRILYGSAQVDKKSIDTIATEVIRGDWGNGAERKRRLEEAGYNYKEVQRKVNEMLGIV